MAKTYKTEINGQEARGELGCGADFKCFYVGRLHINVYADRSGPAVVWRATVGRYDRWGEWDLVTSGHQGTTPITAAEAAHAACVADAA